jgi:hypothetical protein
MNMPPLLGTLKNGVWSSRVPLKPPPMPSHTHAVLPEPSLLAQATSVNVLPSELSHRIDPTAATVRMDPPCMSSCPTRTSCTATSLSTVPFP